MGRIDKVLLREIDLKATAVRNDPNYYLKRAHKIQHALSNSAKIYSWWIEHPELRRIIIGKIDTQKKAHLIGIMKRGVGNLLISWDYIRMQKNIFSSTTLLNLAQKVDPEQNVGYRTIHATLGFDTYVPPNSLSIHNKLDELFYECRRESIHPVERAALIHLGVAGIQPFLSGNKRVARLLQDKVLYDSNLPPAVIKVGERSVYLDLLEQALLGRQDKNLGKQRAFFDYVGGKVNCALDWVLNDLHLGSFRYNYHH
ncbi:Fic family protein [Candidatus Pacearchaeota archaeon]|nr:Fic family protein [Candidatus Pacearchaeota archaeon]